ncbi:HNH endonuclease signature motif containing protein [Mycolicibacterium monacense]|uniref:HNH endonuclease signature motif containing protein n=2 Tax=Mycolicibacterium monacense TaxID=85693 RepID=UPI0009F65CC9|nr:HNH endonuclease signature motif containing protein [Mycolicibacterium monacense]ORB16634.1 HNH nuclease [Mycolicibacterium monacense DSM 44395]QHP86484.1 HNH endonuclease [Mycolicibacterium monacense DSM 44395]
MDGLSGAVDHLVASIAALQTASIDELSYEQIVAELDRIKAAVWAVPSVEHRLTARLMDADPHTLGATSLKRLLADRLRISDKTAGDRLTDARQLGPRHTLTGERVQTELAHTADAVARGDIGTTHVRIIQEFVKKLPAWVSWERRDHYERDLVGHALQLRPDQLKKVADTLLGFIDQDGTEPDHHTHQRRREFTVGRQQADGMSRVSGWLTPEARAHWDLIAAKYAAPGTNLPHDDTHTGRDDRTTGQRHHDALTRAMRDHVQSGALGHIAGVPASIIATMTLSELERAAGWAHTGGGNKIPIRDLIRMAAHSRHYLAVFDDHTEEILYFGRAKRCATTAQRLALFARDRGCTHPGCTVPFYWTEAHHTHDYSRGGRTDIDDLTLACQPANLLIEKTGWTTHRPGNGRTQWTPPEDHDTDQPRINNHFHPHRYLTDNDDGQDGDDGRDDEDDQST